MQAAYFFPWFIYEQVFYFLNDTHCCFTGFCTANIWAKIDYQHPNIDIRYGLYLRWLDQNMTFRSPSKYKLALFFLRPGSFRT
jgi:hypothetical protein